MPTAWPENGHRAQSRGSSDWRGGSALSVYRSRAGLPKRLDGFSEDSGYLSRSQWSPRNGVPQGFVRCQQLAVRSTGNG
jgi:hypothetical protein